MLPDETELKNISDRMLAMSRADQTEVLLFATRSALTRFANSYIHQNVEETGVEVSVRAVIGKKIGVAGTNMLSDESLRAVVERATELAAHQKENEDFRSLPGPEPVQRIDAWIERTASFSPDDRADVVAAICDAARNAGVTAAGAFRTSDNAVAVANSLGIFAYHRETHADINTTMMGGEAAATRTAFRRTRAISTARRWPRRPSTSACAARTRFRWSPAITTSFWKTTRPRTSWTIWPTWGSARSRTRSSAASCRDGWASG